MELDGSKYANECQIGMKWKIKEEDVKDMQDGNLKSKTFKTNIPGVEYFLKLYPNGRNESQRNQVEVYLNLVFQMTKQINASFTISVKSASQNHTFTKKVFEKSEGWGDTLCTREEAFDTEKKFFVDGIMELELKGTLKSQGLKRKAAKLLSLADLLYFSDEDKDVTIVVGDKEIKIHKSILTACSSVFKAELNNSGFNEAKENKIVITDFCFGTVENAICFCYEENIDEYDDFHETASELLHFADKYDMEKLHDYVQIKLIEKMSEDNVVKNANASATSNSADLREFCICFLIYAGKQSTMIDDFDDLNNEIQLEIVQRSFLSGTK